MTDLELQQIKNKNGIIGNNGALNHALYTAAQVANTDLTVLIQGESGVGKEIFSQIIHSLSIRKHNPFIAINCGAIPEGTIDSELFGHEKGAFTSAVDSRKGYFETVSGGTIFLDEIGEMPLGTQARLLRVLETGEFIRVGSSKVQKTNVRVIAATNKDLTNAIKFREDLYYRLSTVPIRVPSLRERSEDVPLLFKKFCVDFAEKYRSNPITLSEEARQVLMKYSWPGNVRQLKNIAEQISVLAPNKNLSAQELISFLPTHQAHNHLPMISRNEPMSGQDTAEKDFLYKMFIDLKKDVTDLRSLFMEMLNSQSYESKTEPYITHPNDNHFIHSSGNTIILPQENNIPVVAKEKEASLNLADAEAELILKAIKKHRKRKKYAAEDLGISERTLYRKIKEYKLEDKV
jgi:DNA-binding NtrC family response regulator